ncbi:unnamed protein product, partial [Polarella glacialis]
QVPRLQGGGRPSLKLPGRGEPVSVGGTPDILEAATRLRQEAQDLGSEIQAWTERGTMADTEALEESELCAAQGISISSDPEGELNSEVDCTKCSSEGSLHSSSTIIASIAAPTLAAAEPLAQHVQLERAADVDAEVICQKAIGETPPSQEPVKCDGDAGSSTEAEAGAAQLQHLQQRRRQEEKRVLEVERMRLDADLLRLEGEWRRLLGERLRAEQETMEGDCRLTAEQSWIPQQLQDQPHAQVQQPLLYRQQCWQPQPQQFLQHERSQPQMYAGQVAPPFVAGRTEVRTFPMAATSPAAVFPLYAAPPPVAHRSMPSSHLATQPLAAQFVAASPAVSVRQLAWDPRGLDFRRAPSIDARSQSPQISRASMQASSPSRNYLEPVSVAGQRISACGGSCASGNYYGMATPGSSARLVIPSRTGGPLVQPALHLSPSRGLRDARSASPHPAVHIPTRSISPMRGALPASWSDAVYQEARGRQASRSLSPHRYPEPVAHRYSEPVAHQMGACCPVRGGTPSPMRSRPADDAAARWEMAELRPAFPGVFNFRR